MMVLRVLWLVGLAAALAPPATAPVAALRTDAATALDSCARAAALLSYKYAEEALRVAAAGTPCAGLETRGVLEAHGRADLLAVALLDVAAQDDDDLAALHHVADELVQLHDREGGDLQAWP